MDNGTKNGIEQDFVKQTKELVGAVVVSLVMGNGRVRVLECERSEEIYKALLGACNEFINLHDGDLKSSVDQLDMSDVKVCETFHETVQSIFEKEINWGRIVSALCVSRTMALKALNQNRVGLVESIVGWLQRIFIDILKDWILKHGGWARFPDKFNPDRKVVKGDKSAGNGWLLAAAGVGFVVVTTLISAR